MSEISTSVKEVRAADGLPQSAAPQFRFRLVLLAWLAATLTAIFMSWILPESYCGQALVRAGRTPAIMSGGESTRMVVRTPTQRAMATEVRRLESNKLLGKVVETLNLNVEWGKRYGNNSLFKTSESIQILRSRLACEIVPGTNVIEIRAYSEEPHEAAKLANAVAESYAEECWKIWGQEATVQLSRLEASQRKNREQVKALRTGLADSTVADAARQEELTKFITNMERTGKLLDDETARLKQGLERGAGGDSPILARAVAGQRPVRPQKTKIVLGGTVVGIASGLALALVVYLCKRGRRRSRAVSHEVELWSRLRDAMHGVIAVGVGGFLGYQSAMPLEFSEFLMLPLAWLVGAALSCLIALARPSPELFAPYIKRKSAWM